MQSDLTELKKRRHRTVAKLSEARRRYDKSTIDHLKYMLRLAQRGQVVGVAYCVLEHDSAHWNYSAGTSVNKMRVLGGVRLLEEAVVRSFAEADE
jgi:hypothetical protein